MTNNNSDSSYLGDFAIYRHFTMCYLIQSVQLFSFFSFEVGTGEKNEGLEAERVKGLDCDYTT